MRGERHDVHAQPAVEGVQIFGERFPGPGHAGAQARQRHAFDLRQHPRDVVAVFGSARRQPEAAVGHEHAGEAVPDARRRQRVPEQLGVVMGMHVDEAGRHDQPRGVDRLGRAAVHRAQRDDLARGNRDVPGVPGRPASIDQESVLDEQIVLHGASPARTVGPLPPSRAGTVRTTSRTSINARFETAARRMKYGRTLAALPDVNKNET